MNIRFADDVPADIRPPAPPDTLPGIHLNDCPSNGESRWMRFRGWGLTPNPDVRIPVWRCSACGIDYMHTGGQIEAHALT